MKLLIAASVASLASAVVVQHHMVCGQYQWWDEANHKCQDCPEDVLMKCWLEWDAPTDPNADGGSGGSIANIADPSHIDGSHYCGALSFFDASCNCCKTCAEGSTNPACMLSPGPTFPAQSQNTSVHLSLNISV